MEPNKPEDSSELLPSRMEPEQAREQKSRQQRPMKQKRKNGN
jgi:hypothetical protein